MLNDIFIIIKHLTQEFSENYHPLRTQYLIYRKLLNNAYG